MILSLRRKRKVLRNPRLSVGGSPKSQDIKKSVIGIKLFIVNKLADSTTTNDNQ